MVNAGLILAHLALYLVSVRRFALLSREKAVIVYHFVFALAVAAVAFLCVVANRDAATLTWAVGVVAMNGLYSISFSICWSLSEGSYSLAMISRLRDVGPSRSLDDWVELQRIGAAKQEQRIPHMVRLRLLEIVNGHLRVTWRGRWVIRLMRLVLWLTDTKQSG